MSAFLRYVITPLLIVSMGAGLLLYLVMTYPLPATTGLAFLTLAVGIYWHRSRRRIEERGWYVGREGRDSMYYAERFHDEWRRIEFDGEMLLGQHRHVIVLPSADGWQVMPSWARHRRTEIVQRVKQDCSESRYLYEAS